MRVGDAREERLTSGESVKEGIILTFHHTNNGTSSLCWIAVLCTAVIE